MTLPSRDVFISLRCRTVAAADPRGPTIFPFAVDGPFDAVANHLRGDLPRIIPHPRVCEILAPVGSSGIRRRKPAKHLPKVPDSVEGGPPHVMWPEDHSGFEPSTFSPAGGARNMWAFFNTLQRGRRRPRDRPPVNVLLTLVLIWMAVIGAIALIAHFGS
jgi:hypothetical protein